MASASTTFRLCDQRPSSLKGTLAEALTVPPLLATMLRSMIEAWPEEVYAQPAVATRFLGRRTTFVCEPQLIRSLLVDQSDALERETFMLRALAPALGRGILTADGAFWRGQRRTAAPMFRPDRIRGFVPAIAAAAEAGRALADGRQSRCPGRRHPAGADAHRLRDHRRHHDLGRFRDAGRTLRPGDRRLPVADAVEDRAGSSRRAGMDAASGRPPGCGRRALPAPGDRPHRRPAPGPRRARPRSARIAAGGARSRNRARPARRRTDRQPPHLRRRRARDDGPGARLDPAAGRRPPRGRGTDARRDRRASRPARREPGRGRAPDLHPAGADGIDAPLSARPLIVRRATAEVRLGEARIPAGESIHVPVYALHRNRALWDRPDAFDPDRFAPAIHAGRDRYAYLPFGAGPRVCIGMGLALTECLVVLATLLPALRFVPERAEMPEAQFRVTLRPRGGIPMRVVARHAG